MIRFIKKWNSYCVLLSVVFAIILGIVTPSIFEHIKFLGDLFINLLKLFALPLICSALIAALGTLSGNTSAFKSLFKKAIGYMLLSEIMAVSIALCLFNLLTPGAGSNADLILHGQPYVVANDQTFGFTQFVTSIIPSNIFYSLTNFQLLPAVVFSILFGFGCALVGEVSKPLVNLSISVRDVSSKCLHGVMLIAPIGIFVLVGEGVAQSHLSGDLQKNFSALVAFVGVFLIGLCIHGLWQLVAVALISKQKISDILHKSLPVFSTAFGTSSSVATLPVAMQTADSLKSNPLVTRFMLPVCGAINVGGMMMYEVAAALFFSQMLGLDLPLSQQILVAIACILGGMAEGGIPESSMVSMVVVFKIVNIPLSAISILLPLDRVLDRLRTMVNIFGNMCGVIIVSHWIGDESLEPSFVEKQP
jgi:Na+/H+-dicarboxylate symporter